MARQGTSPSNQPTDAIKSLAGRLSRIPQIANLSSHGHDEAWTLAISLASIAESGQQVSREIQTQLLRDQLEGDDLLQAVIKLSLDLQHMLYHLEDPRFLRELSQPLRNEWEQERRLRESRLQT